MFRFTTRFLVAAALWTLGGQSLFGFALLGPAPATAAAPDGYQQAPIGYQLGGDIGTPKNLGEGFRWNTRNLYYACDANFLNYFGSNGLVAVDKAFAVLNNLANVSSFTSDLSEWPLNSSRINGRAEAIGLLDLKSGLMNLIVEELGLAEPDRWTWAIRNRFVGPPPGCPIEMLYDVIKRNYDPVTYEPSSYVNGTLYSYTIVEFCVPPNPLADAVEIQVDPSAETFTAVAAGSSAGIPLIGQFYTGLTRDDVGGLRYLWATNRMYIEPAGNGSLLVNTNNSLSLLVTSNLSTLLGAAPTNTAAQLLALFPGLQITSTTQLGFTNVVTTNLVAFFTNSPVGPAGSPPILVVTTTFTTNIVPLFLHTFGNVVTNSVYNQTQVIIQTTNVTTTLSPGILQTNVSTQSYLSNIAGGEFFIIPSNQCGFSIISTQLASLVITTNTIIATNAPGVTNVTGQAFSQDIITLFTNHTLVVSIPSCLTNSVSLRQGIEKIHFYRQDFDSLLSQTWTPITNVYTLTAVTNNAPVTQNLYRVANQPDFLITAIDILGSPEPPAARSISFNATNAGAGLAGPGTINPPVFFTFTKVGPVFQTPGGSLNTIFIPPLFPFPYGESTAQLKFIWGSFDGTTNEPVVYPSGTSILNIENNVFLQILVTGPLPVGHVGQPYNFQLQASGAQPPPYTWSVTNNQAFPGGLPPGLGLNSTNGVIANTPTTAGVYDFVVQVSDTAGRVNTRPLSIEIDP